MERKIDPNITEVPEMPQVLSSLLAYVVEEGQKKFEEEGDFVPFTALAVADKLFFDTYLDSVIESHGTYCSSTGQTMCP